MAIATNGLQIVRIAGAVFNQQLSAADYSEILTANKTATELNAWANSAVAAQFKGKTTTDIAKEVLANLGLTQPGLDAWLAGQLTAGGGVAKAGETMLGLLNDYSNMTADATFGASATTFNTKAAGSQALSQTAGTATGTYAAVSSVVVNTALTLTTATQTSTGTAGDDTFTAAAGTWGTGDIVNGGAGTDTLNATVTGTAPTQSATSLVGVEVLNLTPSPNPTTLDLTGVTGLTQVNNASPANGATLSVTGLGNVVNTTITGGNSSTSIAYATAAVAGTADAATVSLKGAAAGSSFTTSGVETLTINSGTSANTLALSAVGMSKLVVTGDQALTFTGTTGNSGATGVVGTTTFDLSAATGALTLTTGTGTGGTGSVVGTTVTGPTAATAGALNLTTAGLNDTITLGANANTVDAKAGSDTITSGGGANTITPGTGNDTINAGAGVDTIRFAEAGATTADTVNSFGATDVIAVSLGTAATATALASATTGLLGIVQTGATTLTLANVGGTGTGTAIAFQAIAPNATATVGTVAAASNVIALNGAYTDGTVAGVISALGTSKDVGIATTASGKFLLVTYSVGNIAQVWSYAGDTTSNTDIDAAELSLVATLNGVALNGLTAANFSTYLTPVAATTTVSNAGQTINLTGTLNTVQSTANTAGQFMTAGADTINVGVGTLPTAAATAAAGMTIIDPTAGDADVLNATVLAAGWDLGTIVSNVETVNLTMLTSDTGTTGNFGTGVAAFSTTSTLPGTTSLNFLGAGSVGIASSGGAGILGLTTGSAIGLGAGYTGNVNLALGATLPALTLNLNGTAGTSAATSPGLTLGTGGTNTVITALTVNANAATTVNMNLNASQYTTATFNGSGNVTVFGAPADFAAANVVASSPAYSGTLTFRPSSNAAMDFSAGGVVTNLRALDLTDATFIAADTITLPAVTGGGTFTIQSTPATAGTATATGLAVVQLGTSLADTLNLTFGANSITGTTTGGITAASTETLNLSFSPTTALTAFGAGGITLASALGTQTVNVSGTAAFALGTVTADNLSTTGVGSTGSVSATLANGTAGAIFTGGAGAATITGSTSADSLTGGAGNDVLANRATGGNASAADRLVGGAGNDTFILRGDVASGVVSTIAATAANISDFSISGSNGIDILQLSNTTANYNGAGTMIGGGAVAAGSSVITSIATATGTAVATDATADLIKLTTGLAEGVSLQAMFNTAIGGNTVTGYAATSTIFVTMFDTTNLRMVVMTADVATGAGGTTLQTADVVTLVGTVNMSAADYALFGTANFSIIGA